MVYHISTPWHSLVYHRLVLRGGRGKAAPMFLVYSEISGDTRPQLKHRSPVRNRPTLAIKADHGRRHGASSQARAREVEGEVGARLPQLLASTRPARSASSRPLLTEATAPGPRRSHEADAVPCSPPRWSRGTRRRHAPQAAAPASSRTPNATNRRTLAAVAATCADDRRQDQAPPDERAYWPPRQSRTTPEAARPSLLRSALPFSISAHARHGTDEGKRH